MDLAHIENSIKTSLDYAKSCDYFSTDISDLYLTKYYKFAKALPGKLGKAASLPYAIVLDKKPNWIRSIIRSEPKRYPQGMAMFIRGLVTLYQKKHDLGDLDEAMKLGEWLIENKSTISKHSGWGQPFNWRSRSMVFPTNLPRATVTSQVMHALLDLYDVSKKQEFLDAAIDACWLFTNEFQYTPDSNGNHCISYTTLDSYHIHNASMLAAGAIIRALSYNQNDELFDFAMKAARFTASHQNEDGSFYYWAPPDKVNYMIDNYHTGFVLEGFWNIIKYAESTEFDDVYEKGMNFYYENLFQGEVPKFTKQKIYPVDIQSCSQSILSFAMDGRAKYKDHAIKIANFANDKMFLRDNSHFAYKFFEDGSVDDNYYIRWSDSWMVRALALLI